MSLGRKKKFYILMMGNTNEKIKQQHGDYFTWFLKRMEIDAEDAVVKFCVNDDIPTFLEIVQNCKGIIITGSPRMVTEKLPFSVKTGTLLLQVMKETSIPMFGICYGHQLLASLFADGVVDDNPKGVFVGASPIHLTERAITNELFSCLTENDKIYVSHQQAVLAKPREATVLLSAPHSTYFALQYFDNKPIYSIQGHPEFDFPIAKMHVEFWNALLKRAPAISCEETFAGAKLLKRFVSLCNNHNTATIISSL